MYANDEFANFSLFDMYFFPFLKRTKMHHDGRRLKISGMENLKIFEHLSFEINKFVMLPLTLKKISLKNTYIAIKKKKNSQYRKT